MPAYTEARARLFEIGAEGLSDAELLSVAAPTAKPEAAFFAVTEAAAVFGAAIPAAGAKALREALQNDAIAAALAAAEAFKVRVEALLATTRVALPAPEKPAPAIEAAPVPQPEPAKPEAPAKPLKVERPVDRGARIKRTRKVRVNGKAEARA